MLAGVTLDGEAARLAAALDPAFLAEAGWDPVSRVLSMPAGASAAGPPVCRVGGCTATAHGTETGGCASSCSARLMRAGFERGGDLRVPRSCRRCRRRAGCAGARMRADVARRTAGAADRVVQGAFPAVPPHRGRMTMEEFLADPRVRPLPPLRPVPGGGVQPAGPTASAVTAPRTTCGGAPPSRADPEAWTSGTGS